MIDHVGVEVGDYERSKAFYAAALRPLGYELVMEPDATVGGFAAQGKPDFWIEGGTPGGGTHIAFESRERATVHAFHEAGLEAGGKDNGPPGLRPHYHENYYAAYVFDPDGNNVEAVCHSPE
jgi:catechol 2,3-dioxygenase-like lactoylglutathione lyase family enzyme